MMKIEGRAYTEGEKRAVIERVFAAWIQTPHLRLGQLIGNAVGDPYYTEDDELARRLETFAERHGVLSTT